MEIFINLKLVCSGTYCVLMAISIYFDKRLHGKKIEGKYNFTLNFIPKVVYLLLLYFGGFFDSLIAYLKHF